jgi:hypothetical protein
MERVGMEACGIEPLGIGAAPMLALIASVHPRMKKAPPKRGWDLMV